MELIKRRSRKLPMMFLVQIYPTKVSATPSYQSAWSSLHTDMRPNQYESLTEECAQGRGEHAWAMTSACLSSDTADLGDSLDRTRERMRRRTLLSTSRCGRCRYRHFSVADTIV